MDKTIPLCCKTQIFEVMAICLPGFFSLEVSETYSISLVLTALWFHIHLPKFYLQENKNTTAFTIFPLYNKITRASLVAHSKESTCNVGDPGPIPGLGRSPGGGHEKLCQFSCLENPHGQRSLGSYSPWGCKESDMIERLSITRYSQCIISSNRL